MKKFKIKKNDFQIIYNQDFICINACLMLHKDIIELDNDLLQDKIKNNIYFNYSLSTKNFDDKIPDLKILLPEQ